MTRPSTSSEASVSLAPDSRVAAATAELAARAGFAVEEVRALAGRTFVTLRRL